MKHLIVAVILGALSMGVQAELSPFEIFEMTAINNMCHTDQLSVEDVDANIAYLDCANLVSEIAEKVWIEKEIYPSAIQGRPVAENATTLGRLISVWGFILGALMIGLAALMRLYYVQGKKRGTG